MTTRLTDLDEYFSPGLILTVRGKEYTVPLASAELGVWCRHMALATGELTAASTEEETRAAIERVNDIPTLPGQASLPERVLGSVYAEMVADQVPDAYVQYASVTAYIWIVAGDEQAARWWQSGGRPEAPRPVNRAERRATKGKAASTRTAAASATRTPASTSGTKSRAASSPKKATQSPGRKSSNTGDSSPQT